MRQTLGERLQGRANNFDLLRFVAAALVIVSHSFALTGFTEPMVGKATLGTLAVAIFFIMSGFLIAQSWEQHPRLGAFLGKRILRIVPGLAGAILFTVLVIGPAFTNQPLSTYFASRSVAEYVNGVFVYTIGSTLPGVFGSNPVSGAVNGSLWTLPYEFTAYLLVALLGMFALLQRRRRLIALFLLLLPLNYILRRWAPDLHLPFFYLEAGILAQLGTYFMAGTVLYVLRDRVRLSGGLALAALAVFALSSLWPTAWLYVSLLTLPYIVIYLAFMPAGRLTRFGRHGDFSYGLYIYAFPVQQALVAGADGGLSPLRLLALSFPITLLLAMCSWQLIEAPALRLKRRFGRERYPVNAGIMASRPIATTGVSSSSVANRRPLKAAGTGVFSSK